MALRFLPFLLLISTFTQAKDWGQYEVDFHLNVEPNHFLGWTWSCKTNVSLITQENALAPNGDKIIRRVSSSKKELPFVKDGSIQKYYFEHDLSTIGNTTAALEVEMNCKDGFLERPLLWECPLRSLNVPCEFTGKISRKVHSYEEEQLYKLKDLLSITQWTLNSIQYRADLNICGYSHEKLRVLDLKQGLYGYLLAELDFRVDLKIQDNPLVSIDSKDGIFSEEIEFCSDKTPVRVEAFGYRVTPLQLIPYGSGVVFLGEDSSNNWGKVQMKRDFYLKDLFSLKSELLFVLR